MRKTFHVKARVAFSGGEDAAGVYVAIVDADPECDDLLGVGVTNPVGKLTLSFTAEAFNQEPGEAEERPDLYVIVSIEHRGARVPILRRDFPGLRFDGEEDLGTITLPIARGQTPIPAIGLRPAPGASKIVRRLHLDAETIEYGAREVSKVVEQLTGWKGLLSSTRFEIVDGFADFERRRVADLLGRGDLTADELALVERRAMRCDVGMMALWDHTERVVLLNKPILEAQNLDALRLTLAHELVHVGQSTAHPEIDAELRAIQSDLIAHSLAGTECSKERLEAIVRFMANVEGYASYIENLLAGFFTHGTTIWGAKIAARMKMAERKGSPAPKVSPSTSPKTWRDLLVFGATAKSSQYEMGRAAYIARAPADGTAKFDSSFRPELRASSETVDMLEAVAMAGDAASQYELGVLLAAGGDGIARDAEAAKRMFRLAAEGGFAAAAYLLAVHLPADDPERVRWLRLAAIQGFAPAMRLLASTLLRADAPVRDIAEVLVLLEKAAAQDDADAMRDLAAIYEKGIGVPRDVVKARVWSKRADAVSAKRAPA